MRTLQRSIIGAAMLASMAGAVSAEQLLPDEGGRAGSARNRPSGSKPVAGGGAKERARRAARLAVDPDTEEGA